MEFLFFSIPILNLNSYKYTEELANMYLYRMVSNLLVSAEFLFPPDCLNYSIYSFLLKTAASL